MEPKDLILAVQEEASRVPMSAEAVAASLEVSVSCWRQWVEWAEKAKKKQRGDPERRWSGRALKALRGFLEQRGVVA